MEIKEIRSELKKGLFGRKSKSPAYVIQFLLNQIDPFLDVAKRWREYDENDIAMEAGQFAQEVFPLLKKLTATNHFENIT